MAVFERAKWQPCPKLRAIQKSRDPYSKWALLRVPTWLSHAQKKAAQLGIDFLKVQSEKQLCSKKEC